MARTTEDIGLLFVHGVGEQKKLEHLRACARDFASLVAESGDLIRLDVRDECKAEERFVIEAVYRRGKTEALVRLHLHEVWWADLGASGGVGEQIRFWLWSLGQWAAQVVREGNPRQNTMKLMDMPSFRRKSAGRPPKAGARKAAAGGKAGEEPGFLSRLPARLLLFAAGMLAFLTLFSWSAAKRVISFLAQRLPSPTLIFLFLGDVKTYEEPGRHGKGSMLDPDQPMRTTIRRRMVSAMTAMAKRPDYDRWYLFAHSLGTVPAFNALQETEWALPNYLTEAEWKALPERFKTATPFTPADLGPNDQPTLDRMMPRRPPWLEGKVGIDRRQLFARFAGFVTYGSPLDKFAALWPRVVCLNRQVAVFPRHCEWVNLHDPTDPVAAGLGAFAGPARRADQLPADRIGLKPRNMPARAGLLFGLSHIRYFTPPRQGASFDKLKRILGIDAAAAWWRGDGAAKGLSAKAKAAAAKAAAAKAAKAREAEAKAARAKVMPLAIVTAITSGGSLRAAARGAAMSKASFGIRVVLAIAQVLILAVTMALAAAVLLYLVGQALPAAATDLLKQAIHWLWPALLGRLQDGAASAIVASGGAIMVLAFVAVLLSGVVRMIADLLRPPHG